MLWVTTCASIALVLGTLALLGWRRELRDEALSEEFAQRSPRPQQQAPKRKVGFSGTLDNLKTDARRKAG